MDSLAHNNFVSFWAYHPHWHGHLLLSMTDDTLILEEYNSHGRYVLSGQILTVNWDRYPPEKFTLKNGIYVQDSVKLPDLTHALLAKLYDQNFRIRSFSVELPNGDHVVTLRSGTSDISAFKQVFVDRQYESKYLPATASNIIDLGANIGLASLFFGIKYSEANIVSVEPDAGNFDLLCANVRQLPGRMMPLLGAAWYEDGMLHVHKKSDEGVDLGAWGVQVSKSTHRSDGEVAAFSLPTLIDKLDGDIDILKVDIEGAELEVFEKNATEWLRRVKLITIETHDRFRPGSDAAVRTAVLSSGFVELPRVGENLFFSRV